MIMLHTTVCGNKVDARASHFKCFVRTRPHWWTDWCPITVNAQKAGYVACFWVCMLSQLCLTDCCVITPRKSVMCFPPICIFKFDQKHPKKIAWRHNDRQLRLAHDQNPPIGLPPSATWPRWFQYLIRYWKRRGPVVNAKDRSVRTRYGSSPVVSECNLNSL